MKRDSFVLMLLLLLTMPDSSYGQAIGGHVIRKAPKTTNAVVVDNAPRGKQSQAVDLGLPSGTKWAEWNIGASSPEQYGNYYAWGETSTKTDYSFRKYFDSLDYEGKKFKTYYLYFSENRIGKYSVVGTSRDVANVKWGNGWHMPTANQMEELVKCCKWGWVTHKGIKGLQCTGPNGNTIFFPAAGEIHRKENNKKGDYCLYWSGEMLSSERLEWRRQQNWDFFRDATVIEAHGTMYDGKVSISVDTNLRKIGCPVRAVKDK